MSNEVWSHWLKHDGCNVPLVPLDTLCITKENPETPVLADSIEWTYVSYYAVKLSDYVKITSMPNASHCSHWAEALAQDSNGQWREYNEIPDLAGREYTWGNSGDRCTLLTRGTVLGDWKDTLQLVTSTTNPMNDDTHISNLNSSDLALDKKDEFELNCDEDPRNDLTDVSQEWSHQIKHRGSVVSPLPSDTWCRIETPAFKTVTTADQAPWNMVKKYSIPMADYRRITEMPRLEDAPKWAEALAQDSTGRWYWYEDQPIKKSSIRWKSMGRVQRALEGTVLGDWRDTLYLVSIADKEVNEKHNTSSDGSTAAQYPRYYKDVHHLSYVDVYRVHRLFGVEDNEIHHASKKLLLCGVRTGGKPARREVTEARDTLNRWLEIMDEDSQEI